MRLLWKEKQKVGLDKFMTKTEQAIKDAIKKCPKCGDELFIRVSICCPCEAVEGYTEFCKRGEFTANKCGYEDFRGFPSEEEMSKYKKI